MRILPQNATIDDHPVGLRAGEKLDTDQLGVHAMAGSTAGSHQVAASIKQKFNNVRRNLSDGIAPLLPEYFPVAWKLGLSISIMILLGMAVLGSVLMSSQLSRMQSQADEFGGTLAQQLADTTREPLLAEDHFSVNIILGNLLQSESLRGAALFDSNGALIEQVGSLPRDTLPTANSNMLRWRNGTEQLTTYFAPVKVNELTAGHAAISLSRAPIDAAREAVRQTILTATLVMSLIAIVVAFLVSRRLSRPIHDLLEAATALRAGNLEFRLSDRRNDEIGQLVDAYHNMASGLLEKNQVEKVLSRFVSPTVAKKMMSDLKQVSLGGREVEATVVFADIVGFTRLSESIAPDAVAELLNAYFNAISMAATFYRGTIDKYMGDCAMIIFGIPEDDSEHSYHGLCCAIMIQRLVDRLNVLRSSRGLTTVNFRIGINTGTMLAGNLGSHDRMQYTVVGDSVNLASRLSNMAGAGEVVACSEMVTKPNIQSRVRLRQSGAMRVRGRSESVDTFIVEGVHAQSETLMEQRIATFISQLMDLPLRAAE
ncbi:MAG: adenylate/guanylate cyclase domain-containing protein [Alcanivoracaceae bacterium]|nr:adenylate/guanylate cyclase domain-containing protein [Alcanivoracaceae bacterium]